MTLRRTAALIAVAMLAGLWVAVGSSGHSREDGRVTLTLSAISSTALTELVEEYSKVAPDVRIKLSATPIDTYQTVLRTRLASGNAPDMFSVWPGNGNSMAVAQVAPLGTLADLSGTAWARSVPAAFKPLLGAGGKVQMWTPGSNVIGAHYNKAVFARAGVSIPRTWGELLAACDAFRRAGFVPIAVGNQTPWVAQLIDYALAPTYAYARDARPERDGFVRSGWRETLGRYVELSRRGCFQPNPNGTSLERVEAMVAGGKAAMAVLVASAHASLVAANPQAEFGLFPFPAADRAEDLRVPAGLSSGLAINAHSEHVVEARRFVEFLARPENAARFNAEASILGLDGTPGVEFLKPFLPYFHEHRTVTFPDQLWPNADTQREHIAVAQDLLAGRESVDGGLRRLDRAYALR